MRYEIVAEAYRDLEAASARLELIDRLAELFRETPTELLPTLLDGRRPTDLLEVVSHLTWHLPTPVRRPSKSLPAAHLQPSPQNHSLSASHRSWTPVRPAPLITDEVPSFVSRCSRRSNLFTGHR